MLEFYKFIKKACIYGSFIITIISKFSKLLKKLSYKFKGVLFDVTINEIQIKMK